MNKEIDPEVKEILENRYKPTKEQFEMAKEGEKKITLDYEEWVKTQPTEPEEDSKE